MKNNLIPPYVLNVQTSYGYSNAYDLTENQAVTRAKELIDNYTALGYSQVKEGAYLFSHSKHNLTISIKIFNVDNRLVTHHLLTKKEIEK